MKEQWKETLKQRLTGEPLFYEEAVDFISNLLTEQREEVIAETRAILVAIAPQAPTSLLNRTHMKQIKRDAEKDLINQILSEAPEDMSLDDIMEHLFITRSSYNACNAQWRSLLTNHLK